MMLRIIRFMMNEVVKIGCIVVLYNPDEAVVNRIAGYPENIDCIVLVDNSDTNNAMMFSRVLSEKVKYVPLFENTGIAHAMNEGIRCICDKTEYIITMDQDSSLNKQIIDTYRDYIRKHPDKVFALTPKYHTDRRYSEATSGEKEILLSMQSGTLFSNKLFSMIGLFNEALFLDVVDWEYFLRMHKHGYSLIRCNSALLDHQPAETREGRLLFITLKYGIASPVRYYYQARNLLWVAKKYHSIALYKDLLIKYLKIILLFDNKRIYLKYSNSGIVDAKRNKLGKFQGGLM